MIEEFIEPSKKHEQLLVGFMWSNPQLYRKFKNHNITDKTFTDKKWYFYYRLGELMFENGIRTFDDVTVHTFIESRITDRKKLMDRYVKYGEFDTVDYLMSVCTDDKNNEEYHLYEILKYEALRKFLELGLIDKDNKELIKKLKLMNLKQTQMYFNHQIKNAFRNVNSGQVEIVDVVDEEIYDEIEEMDKGIAMGIPIFHAPRLTKTIKGWKRGKLIYIIMPSGVGKSTMIRSVFLMTLLTQNQKALIFVNEEGKTTWRMSLLAVVATYILKKRISRDKIFEGKYDDYTKKVLREAADWLIRNRPDMLKLVVLKKYRFEDVLNYAEYYKALGMQYMILDTFKSDGTQTDMARWQVFSDNSQDLYDLVKEENLNIGTIATLQLKIGKVYRFLDHECVGKSKEVVEVADATMLGRLLFADEYEGGKNAIFAFNYEKEDGKWVKKKYTLDPEKQYIIFFFGKNRMGSASKQIIYEINYDFNELIEVAYAEMKPESTAF
jgi:replicative DNA helicase